MLLRLQRSTVPLFPMAARRIPGCGGCGFFLSAAAGSAEISIPNILTLHREPPLGGVAIMGRPHRAGPLDCFVARAPRNDKTIAAGSSATGVSGIRSSASPARRRGVRPVGRGPVPCACADSPAAQRPHAPTVPAGPPMRRAALADGVSACRPCVQGTRGRTASQALSAPPLGHALHAARARGYTPPPARPVRAVAAVAQW